MLLDRDISAIHATFDTDHILVFQEIMRTPSRAYRQQLNDSGIYLSQPENHGESTWGVLQKREKLGSENNYF